MRAADQAYCRAIGGAAVMTPLDLWYFRLDYDVLATTQRFKGGRKLVDRAAERAGQRTNLGALNKLTEVVDGKRIIKSRPPLVMRLPARIRSGPCPPSRLADEYLSTLQPNRRTLLRRYTVADAARKVVGVGSVGTSCLIVLLLADDAQPLFLQMKEATAVRPRGPSRPQPARPVGPAGRHRPGGDPGRQRRLPRLGPLLRPGGSGTDYYFRQLWDGKYSPRCARSPRCSSTPTPGCAGRRWPGPTPVPVTQPPSPGTWVTARSSSSPWWPTRWRTPSLAGPTTPSSWPPSARRCIRHRRRLSGGVGLGLAGSG